MLAETVVDLLNQAAFGDTGLVRILHGRSELTELRYPKIRDRAEQTAAKLVHQYGVKSGDVIVLIMPTEPAFYDLFFGAMLAGAIPCALYPPVRFGFLPEWQMQTAGMIDRVSARYVVCDQRLIGLMRGTTKVPLIAAKALDGNGSASRAVMVVPDPDDTAVIQFSSGTTGAPKPIPISHRNIMFNLAVITGRFPAVEPVVGVSWLPLYHDLGLFGTFMVSLACRSEITLIAPELFLARPRLWLETISERRAHISPAPNFAFGVAAKKITDTSGLDLSSWRMAICAAETIQPETMAKFCTKFGPVGFDPRSLTPGYGLAETTLAVTMNSWHESPRWMHCDAAALSEEGHVVERDAPTEETLSLAGLGRPFPGVEVEIRSDSGKTLEANRLGHVFVQSPGIPRSVTEDWLDTGDLGFVNQGELFLYGRAKDTVIIRGRNFDPALIEACLLGIDGVRSGCVVCFSVEDLDVDSESLVIIAERAVQGQDKGVCAEIRSKIMQRLQLEPAVIELVAPGTLPRTSSGKLSRSRARKLFQESTLKGPRAMGNLRFLARSLVGQLGITTR